MHALQHSSLGRAGGGLQTRSHAPREYSPATALPGGLAPAQPVPCPDGQQGRGRGGSAGAPGLGSPGAGLLGGAAVPCMSACLSAFRGAAVHTHVRILKQRRRAVCSGGSLTPSLVTSFCCLSFAVSCHVCFLEAPFLTSHPVPWGVSGLALPGLRVCCRLWGEEGPRWEAPGLPALRSQEGPGLVLWGLVTSEPARGRTREEGVLVLNVQTGWVGAAGLELEDL